MTGRGQVGELVARLTEARGCDEARDALRRTLGDPSLDLGFRQQETGRYTNAEVASARAPVARSSLDTDPRAAGEMLDSAAGSSTSRSASCASWRTESTRRS